MTLGSNVGSFVRDLTGNVVLLPFSGNKLPLRLGVQWIHAHYFSNSEDYANSLWFFVDSMTSSIRSKISASTSVPEKRSLRRMDSFESDSSFDEPAPSFTGHISSTGVDDSEAEMSADDTVVSEGSQDSLQAWRNRIKGIADSSFQSPRSNSIESEFHNWTIIYDANPEIELTVLLLQVRFCHVLMTLFSHKIWNV